MRWTLAQDLELYGALGIDQVGLSLAKLEHHGLDDAVARVTGAGLRVTNVLAVGQLDLLMGAEVGHGAEAAVLHVGQAQGDVADLDSLELTRADVADAGDAMSCHGTMIPCRTAGRQRLR